MSALYAGIEAGGTKFVCAIGSGPDDILAETSFPTTTPGETLERTAEFFRKAAGRRRLRSLGIASFGPLDLNPASSTFGYITTTPKAGWSQVNFMGQARDALGLPVFMDTDVNAAALSESLWGVGRGRDPLVYITVGTGIGGGLLVKGTPVHGLQHPEIGHMYMPHDKSADPFPGACPYHGDCLEGLAAGPALAKRWGQPAETLPPEHPAWELEATYLAYALSNLTCTIAPQAIVLGGGVASQPHLLGQVRRAVERLLNGYIQSPWLKPGLEAYIVPPGLGSRAGVLGAIALAAQGAQSKP
jgi:fructokinase